MRLLRCWMAVVLRLRIGERYMSRFLPGVSPDGTHTSNCLTLIEHEDAEGHIYAYCQLSTVTVIQCQ